MLADSLALLDRDRAAFLSAYDALTPAQRAFRPADGGWTADEVVQHLVKSETGTLRIVAKQAAAGDARRDVGPPDAARLSAVEAFLRSDSRTAMPTAAEPFIRPDNPHGTGWRERLAALHADWHALAHTFPADLEHVGLMAHLRAGTLTAEGAARVSAAHLAHHTHQIARLRAADGFPT